MSLPQLQANAPWDQFARTVINHAIKRLGVVGSPEEPSIVTGGARTLTLADQYQTLRLNSASAQTVTIPTNAAVPFEIGTAIRAVRLGAGLVTFSPDTGVTLRKPTGIKPNQHLGASVRKAANQTTADYTTATAMAFDQEISDDGGWHDNSTNNTRLTVPTGLGIKRVDISAIVTSTSNTADTFSFVEIRKSASGNWDGYMAALTDGATTAHRIAASGTNITVADGDYFELFYQTESDASITIVATNTNFSIKAVSIDPVGTIAYQYGEIELVKIGTDEWAISGPGLG